MFYSFFSICFESDLFVSVVSIRIRNTKRNRKFLKQTENKPKQMSFTLFFVSWTTFGFILLFRFFLVCFKADLFVSVVSAVSKRVKNTEMN
jgi:hypothetical protein